MELFCDLKGIVSHIDTFTRFRKSDVQPTNPELCFENMNAIALGPMWGSSYMLDSEVP